MFSKEKTFALRLLNALLLFSIAMFAIGVIMTIVNQIFPTSSSFTFFDESLPYLITQLVFSVLMLIIVNKCTILFSRDYPKTKNLLSFFAVNAIESALFYLIYTCLIAPLIEGQDVRFWEYDFTLYLAVLIVAVATLTIALKTQLFSTKYDSLHNVFNLISLSAAAAAATGVLSVLFNIGRLAEQDGNAVAQTIIYGVITMIVFGVIMTALSRDKSTKSRKSVAAKSAKTTRAKTTKRK